MVYDFRVDDATMIKLLEETKEHGGLVQVHAENVHIIDHMNAVLEKEGKLAPYYHAVSRPNIAEEEAIYRASKMVEMTGSRIYIVHLSSKEGLWVVKAARDRGVNIYAETCPQYLSLTNQAVLERGPLGKVGPPLREKEDNEAIWRGLASRAIDTVGSDSCGIKAEHKEWGGASRDFITGQGAKPRPDNIFEARFGAPSVEPMLQVIYHDGVNEGRITLMRLVQTMCENPAKIFGLYPKKGVIQEGSDADIVVFDPAVPHTISVDGMHGNADFTLFEGKQVTGATVFSMQRGEVLIEDGQLRRKQGSARFLPGNCDLAAYAKKGYPVA